MRRGIKYIIDKDGRIKLGRINKVKRLGRQKEIKNKEGWEEWKIRELKTRENQKLKKIVEN